MSVTPFSNDPVSGAAAPPDLTAAQALRRMQAGELTCEAYVSALMARAEALASLHAMIALNERAIEQARRVDQARRQGRPMGPLAGLPLVVKDNINTRDMPTTAGTAALRGFVPNANAPVLQRLLDAGAIVFGKANMHELAFGSTTTNAVWGHAQNPYDRRRIPGGSSGGTAAAVAARLCPVGLGTDTGASVRNPAALCGVAGLRPSIGNGGAQRRYAGEGVAPISHTRDTVGPIGRTVEDLALIDAAVTGEAVPAAMPAERIKLGVPRQYFWENLDQGVRDVCEAALRQLADAGVTLIEADLPDVERLDHNTSLPIAMYEIFEDFPAYLKASGSTLSLQAVIDGVGSPDVRSVLAAARDVGRDAYLEALQTWRPRLVQCYADYFARHGVQGVVFPTVPITAPPIDVTFSGAVSINGVPQPGGPAAEFGVLIRNTDPGSNAGVPGLALPAGLAPDGLPVGLEIDGPVGSDNTLLAIGLTVERLLGTLPAPQR